ncbi:MAG: hypothetical protein WCK42_04980 [Myxococcaceae bacterium]
MTDLELIFSMLGEAATKEIAVNQNAQGFTENKAAAELVARLRVMQDTNLSKKAESPWFPKKTTLTI